MSLFHCEPEIGEPKLDEAILGEPSSQTFLFMVHVMPTLKFFIQIFKSNCHSIFIVYCDTRLLF